MKTLNYFSLAIALIFSFAGVSTAATVVNSAGVAAKGDTTKIRVVNIDSSKHQGEYDKALNTDPWKGFNMAMFKFNDALDQFILSPISRAYGFIMPQWGRDRVSNVFNNFEEPSNMANSLLQGDIEGVFHSFWRFAINSTFGVGGIGDVAGGFGLKEKDRSFSQTLAVYGVGTGPYVVLPFIGPSTPRDFASFGAAMAANPSSYFDDPASYIAGGMDAVQTRESILGLTDDMRKNSFDLYSSYKSSYLQHRKKKVVDNIGQ